MGIWVEILNERKFCRLENTRPLHFLYYRVLLCTKVRAVYPSIFYSFFLLRAWRKRIEIYGGIKIREMIYFSWIRY
jgi:hypothetical protein